MSTGLADPNNRGALITKFSDEPRVYARQIRANNERIITLRLIETMAVAGWNLTELDDGDDLVPVKSIAEAMEHIFNLDEVHMYFANKGGDCHGAYLIFDNGHMGLDVISDYNYSLDPEDTFEATMERVYAFIDELTTELERA